MVSNARWGVSKFKDVRVMFTLCEEKNHMIVPCQPPLRVTAKYLTATKLYFPNYSRLVSKMSS